MEWQLDGGATHTGSPAVVDADGEQLLEVRAVDGAGNATRVAERHRARRHHRAAQRHARRVVRLAGRRRYDVELAGLRRRRLRRRPHRAHARRRRHLDRHDASLSPATACTRLSAASVDVAGHASDVADRHDPDRLRSADRRRSPARRPGSSTAAAPTRPTTPPASRPSPTASTAAPGPASRPAAPSPSPTAACACAPSTPPATRPSPRPVALAVITPPATPVDTPRCRVPPPSAPRPFRSTSPDTRTWPASSAPCTRRAPRTGPCPSTCGRWPSAADSFRVDLRVKAGSRSRRVARTYKVGRLGTLPRIQASPARRQRPHHRDAHRQAPRRPQVARATPPPRWCSPREGHACPGCRRRRQHGPGGRQDPGREGVQGRARHRGPEAAQGRGDRRRRRPQALRRDHLGRARGHVHQHQRQRPARRHLRARAAATAASTTCTGAARTASSSASTSPRPRPPSRSCARGRRSSPSTAASATRRSWPARARACTSTPAATPATARPSCA